MHLRDLVICVAGAAVLSGCASGPQGASGAASDGSATPGAFKACMAADSDGFADGAENQAAYEGMLQAATELNFLVSQAQADADADYASTVNDLAEGGCSLIVTVGDAHAGDAQTAAQAHPDVFFLLVDAQAETPQTNLKPLLFDTADAAFLAGYVAAAQASNDRAAVASDADDVYRNGFTAGVDYYNQAKGTNVTASDTDGAVSDSVRKVVDAAVITTIGEATRGQFTSAPYFGTLKDGGVDIVPLPDDASDELQAEVAQLRAGLIDGSITPPAAG